MTSSAQGPTGLISSLLWRTVTPGDFFNIERAASAGPKGGGGQRYIDIPLGSGISLNEFGQFFGEEPLDDDELNWATFEIDAYSILAPVVLAPLVLTPRRGKNRRYRIANQNRQATGGHRHPAWSMQRGFPQAPDDVSGSKDPRMPDLSLLKVFIARSEAGDFFAGYTNAGSMPLSAPQGIGLDVLFRPNAEVRADGIIHIAAEARFSAEHLSRLISSPTEAPNAPAEGSPLLARVVRRSPSTQSTRQAGTTPGGEPAPARPDPSAPLRTQAPHASSAEDWVGTQLLATHEIASVQRIGHTDREREHLADGLLPGADFIIADPDSDKPQRFIEVKSAAGSFPTSIRLTASELRRAKQCAADGIPYDIWVVVIDGPSMTHSRIPNFEQDATQLMIEDLVTLEIRIAVD